MLGHARLCAHMFTHAQASSSSWSTRSWRLFSASLTSSFPIVCSRSASVTQYVLGSATSSSSASPSSPSSSRNRPRMRYSCWCREARRAGACWTAWRAYSSVHPGSRSVRGPTDLLAGPRSPRAPAVAPRPLAAPAPSPCAPRSASCILVHAEAVQRTRSTEFFEARGQPFLPLQLKHPAQPPRRIDGPWNPLEPVGYSQSALIRVFWPSAIGTS